MKVLGLLLTNVAAEPDFEQSFIDGYNSAGGNWDGTFTIVENVSNLDIDEEFLEPYIDDGYELIVRNTSPSPIADHIYSFTKENGMLFVNPVGSNAHEDIGTLSFENKFSLVTCGSGLSNVGNATSYPCMFFDCATVEANGMEIVDIRQCGTSYNVTQVRRASATVLWFKLEGLETEEDLNNIGLIMYQNSAGSNHSFAPIYFANLTGSDVVSLPTGLQYVSFVGEGEFAINYTTSAGTIGNYQDITGTMTFGWTDNTKVLLQLKDYNPILTGQGTTIQDVSGFENSPNGRITIADYINPIGYGDQATFVFDLGAGSYEGGGKFYFATQSYATPFIGGKLAFIKDTNQCSWDESISRALTTATNQGQFDNINGYGTINVADANSRSDTMLTVIPILELTEIIPGIIELLWTLVPFATHYEIYLRGELYKTVIAQITTERLIVPKQANSKKNAFTVRAVNETETGEFSNICDYRHYYYPYILVKNQTLNAL
jgi:hypothetical protein